MEMTMPNLSDGLIDQCLALLYGAWAESYDNLKKVKTEKNDGDPDWGVIHNIRLLNAIKEEAKLKKLLDELSPYSPILKLQRLKDT